MINSLKARLKLDPVRRERLTLNTLGSNNYSKKECDMVEVRLQGRQGSTVTIVALSFPTICAPLPSPVEIDQYPHLQELELADHKLDHTDCGESIDVLIGSDFYWDVVTGVRIRAENGPVAVSSVFGWLISGPLSVTADGECYTTSNLIAQGSDTGELGGSGEVELVNALNRFWDTESIGIRETPVEESANAFPPDIVFDWEQERYRVGLPWKSEVRPYSDAYYMCVTRLHQLSNRLARDKSLYGEYDAVFRDQLVDGIIELAPKLDPGCQRYFIPHHGIVRTDKQTTKLRVVFDGSAKDKKESFSLNDCLEKGPNLTPHIFDILLRFRSHLVGLVADIEKAFHQIVIEENDRDYLRFLWFDDIHKARPEIVEYRFARLVFGLTPSPAILNGTIQSHLTRFLLTEPNMSRLLADGFYVDDFTGGAGSDEEGFQIYERAKILMQKGGLSGEQTP